MIGLMQKSAGQQFFSGVLEEFALLILCTHRNHFGAGNILAKVGNAQAPFTAALPAFLVNDYRIDQDQLGAGVFLERYIDHRDASRNTDLRSGQPDAARRVHRLKHILDKFLKLAVEGGHFGGGFFQDGVAEFYDWIDHLSYLSTRLLLPPRLAPKRRARTWAQLIV